MKHGRSTGPVLQSPSTRVARMCGWGGVLHNEEFRMNRLMVIIMGWARRGGLARRKEGGGPWIRAVMPVTNLNPLNT